ncbi:MFS transporter [Parascardovia denticolens]
MTMTARKTEVSPYRRIFALPGAVAFSSTGALTRMPMAMVSLGIILMLNQLYDNWTTAGVMTAVYVLSAALVTPIYARLFDRWGQKKLGLALTLLQVLFYVSFALAAQARAPLPLLYLLAVLLGLTSFSVGALVRTRWAWATARESTDSLLDTAYSLESAIDETAFIIGPILVAALATAVSPTLPFYVCAAANGIGGLIFFLLPSASHRAIGTLTEIKEAELGQDRAEPGEGSAALPPEAGSAPEGPLKDAHPKKLAFLYPGILILCFVFMVFNSSFSAFDEAMTALMRSSGQSRFLGVQLAMFAVGSCAGALIFGSRKHQGNPWTRLLLLMGFLMAGFMGIAVFAHSHDFLVIGLIEVVFGLSIAPIFATGNLMIKEIVPDSSLTEGLSWLSTANTIGSALGSAFCGRLLDSFGPVFGLSSLWILLLAAFLLIILGYARHGRRLNRQGSR